MRGCRTVAHILERQEAMGSQAEASVRANECPRKAVKGPQGTPQLMRRARTRTRVTDRLFRDLNERMARG